MLTCISIHRIDPAYCTIRTAKVLFTVHFYFTERIPGIIAIVLRIRRMSPVVVVDDVSPVVRT